MKIVLVTCLVLVLLTLWMELTSSTPDARMSPGPAEVQVSPLSPHENPGFILASGVIEELIGHSYVIGSVVVTPTYDTPTAMRIAEQMQLFPKRRYELVLRAVAK